jgi:PAS domain S-box-containing protein
MGAWSRNLSTGEVWWSRELEEIFALPPGGFAGTEAGFFAFVHPDDRARVEEAVGEAVSTDTDYVVEFRFRGGDDRWRWMDGRGRAVYGDNGTPLWLYGLGIDITERKEADAALAAARAAADADAARLHLAMAAARLGDWSWDIATDIVTLSPGAAEIFGVAPGPRLTWAQVRGLLHRDDRERAQRAVEVAVETRGDYAIEYRVVQDGRERWVSARGRPRFDLSGTPLGMQGVVQDVSHDRLLVHLDDAMRGLTVAADITATATRMLGQHLGVQRCAYATVDDEQGTLVVTGNYTHGAQSLVGRHRLATFGTYFERAWNTGEVVAFTDTEANGQLSAEEVANYQAASIGAAVSAPILRAGRLVAGMAVHSTRPRAWQPHEIGLVQQVASRCWESIQRAQVEAERAALLARERLARLEAEEQNRRLATL